MMKVLIILLSLLSPCFLQSYILSVNHLQSYLDAYKQIKPFASPAKVIKWQEVVRNYRGDSFSITHRKYNYSSDKVSLIEKYFSEKNSVELARAMSAGGDGFLLGSIFGLLYCGIEPHVKGEKSREMLNTSCALMLLGSIIALLKKQNQRLGELPGFTQDLLAFDNVFDGKNVILSSIIGSIAAAFSFFGTNYSIKRVCNYFKKSVNPTIKKLVEGKRNVHT